VAKNVVAAGLADRFEIQLAYTIGIAKPASVSIETFGTEHVPGRANPRRHREALRLRPAGIIEALDLRRPIYKATAAYGHFGRTDQDFPWERTDHGRGAGRRVRRIHSRSRRRILTACTPSSWPAVGERGSGR